MEITWRREKEQLNLRKHGMGFSLARTVLEDPLSVTVLESVRGGEERWQTTGTIQIGGWFRTVVLIHTYPEPDDETQSHVISLREAAMHERKRYEVLRF